MKLSFGIGLLAALAGMALAAPADTVAQNQRRNVDVSQDSATHDMAQLDSQKLSHSMAELNTENEKREISEQQGKPKNSGLLGGLLTNLLGGSNKPKGKKPKKPKATKPKKPAKSPSKPAKEPAPAKTAEEKSPAKPDEKKPAPAKPDEKKPEPAKPDEKKSETPASPTAEKPKGS